MWLCLLKTVTSFVRELDVEHGYQPETHLIKAKGHESGIK